MTADGKIACSSGHSAWVSSPDSRKLVFEARARSDAIIVGGNTVRPWSCLCIAVGLLQRAMLRWLQKSLAAALLLRIYEKRLWGWVVHDV